MADKFITINQAEKLFSRKHKTFYRLVNELKSTASNTTHIHRHFMRPSHDELAALKESNKKVVYRFSIAYLTQKFGEPKSDNREANPVPDTPVHGDGFVALEALYKARIDDLKDQLKEERKARAELLKYAKSDKELFAQANANLTQVLALPGITEAKRAEQGTTEVINTIPKPVVVEQKPRPKSTARSSNKKKPQSKAKASNKDSRISRFFFGSRTKS